MFANWTRHALLEHPRWYPHDHKDVNDLIDLASKKGRFEQLLREHFNVEDVWPRTWKGNVPKAIMTERIVSRLSEEERALVVLTPRSKAPEHNCVDAIGIGLWRIGRL